MCPTSVGCTSPSATVRQQRDKLESLAASTRLVARDWIDGQLSQRYTRTAFAALFEQVEQQRSSLAATPQTLADPQGAALSQQAEQLSRLIAEMIRDVERDDAGAVRGRLGGIPLANR